jgi:hypothetical protein
LVPCISTSHSPGPHNFSPVLSTSKCTDRASPSAPALFGCHRGTTSVADRRVSVAWSGTGGVRPSRLMNEPVRPSAWR